MNPLTPPLTTADAYYPTFSLPPWLEAGEEVGKLLATLSSSTFRDIDRGAERPIEEAFEAVLDALAEPQRPDVTHHRYVTLALILALASQAWIRKYDPTDQRAAALTDEVSAWLSRGAPITSPRGADLYPLEATRHQHLDEDREVHRALSQMPEAPERCRTLLLDILDLTIAGFAIHPGGGLARRDVFHWWLCQAVPAAYLLRLPDHVYSGDWPWPPTIRR